MHFPAQRRSRRRRNSGTIPGPKRYNPPTRIASNSGRRDNPDHFGGGKLQRSESHPTKGYFSSQTLQVVTDVTCCESGNISLLCTSYRSTLSVHKLTILLSLIRPLEHISATKAGFRLGRNVHFDAPSSPVPDVRFSAPRWFGSCPRTLPPSDPLFPHSPRCGSDLPTNGHRPSCLGSPIFRPTCFTLVHYAINALPFRHGRDQDRVGQVYRQTGHLDAFTQDAIGRDKGDVPIERIGCAHQCSFDFDYRERNGTGRSRGEVDSQDIYFTRKRSCERNHQAGSFPGLHP